MEASAFVAGDFVDQALKAVYGAQTEIMIFLIAFGIHALFFGKLSVRSKPASRTQTKKVISTPNSESPHPAARQQPRGHNAKELARLADHYCAIEDADKVADELRMRIEKVPFEDTVDALSGLLEAAGKNATAPLLAAVRRTLRDRGLKPDVELGEFLLRYYFGLRLLGDFDEVYRELVLIHGALPSLDILALKAALRGCDLEVCFERMTCLPPIWTKDAVCTPSAGPVVLMQQLVRLAAQERALPRLLDRLQEINLLHDAMDAVIVECVQRGDAADVTTVLKSCQKHNVQLGDAAYCAMMKDAQSPSEALRLFQEAVTKTGVIDIFSVACEWALEHNDGQMADAVLRQLPTNASPATVGKLLRFYGAAESGKALHLYGEKFKGIDLSADIKAMHLITQQAIEAGQRGQTILAALLCSTTETARVSLIKSLASDKQLLSALEVYRVCPDKRPCLYNAAIDACIDCRSMEDAQQVMSDAVRAGAADTITYNTIVKAYLQAKLPQEARRAVESMKRAGLHPNCVTFNELLDSIVKTSIEDAWPVLDEMRAAGIRPNRITCAILLKAVQARTKSSDVERVIAVLDEMEEDVDEVLLCSVVDACIRAGRAELLIPQLKRQRLSGKTATVKSAHTYGSIIRAYGFVGDIAGVWETWREMRTRHVPANAVTMGCMTEALVTNGEPEGAYELINEMLKDEQWAPLINAVIYCSVLKGFSHQKRFDRMWTVYKEMLGLKLQFSIVTFNTLVDACSRNGEMSRIPALLKDMVAQGINPNIITYSAILKGYCQENRIEEAFSVVQGMIQTTSFRPDEIMFNTLLDGCARQGLYERGIGVLEDMQKAGVAPTNFTLSVLVKLASRSRKLDNAFQLCQEISSKYRFRLNVHVYANLVNACITNKDVKRAFEVLEKMLSERVRPDTRTYSLLLRALVTAGDSTEVAGVLRAAVGLRDAHPRLSQYDSRLLQAQGGLPPALIAEILEGISGQCHDEHKAVGLLKDLRGLQHIKLDPKLQFRLATHALKQ